MSIDAMYSLVGTGLFAFGSLLYITLASLKRRHSKTYSDRLPLK